MMVAALRRFLKRQGREPGSQGGAGQKRRCKTKSFAPQGVSRAFAMAITVFEVLALPNAVLPLCGGLRGASRSSGLPGAGRTGRGSGWNGNGRSQN